jgi:hypothetical protein
MCIRFKIGEKELKCLEEYFKVEPIRIPHKNAGETKMKSVRKVMRLNG